MRSDRPDTPELLRILDGMATDLNALARVIDQALELDWYGLAGELGEAHSTIKKALLKKRDELRREGK